MAAVLAFGPEAVLSHRSAGQLWGLVPRSSIASEVIRPGRVRRPHLVALLVPDAENAKHWAESRGKRGRLADLINDGEFRRHLTACWLEAYWARLHSTTRIRRRSGDSITMSARSAMASLFCWYL